MIVTHDDAQDLPGCLDAVAELDHRSLELVLVDCASSDGSAAVARKLIDNDPRLNSLPHQLLELTHNLGFAGGMNAALGASQAPYVLLLNADARPAPAYIDRLLPHLLGPHRVGGATGRLQRPPEDGQPMLDACGMHLTRNWRHLDRGAGETDQGQLDRAEEVFGATGAASLFARSALEDVAVDGEVFDPAFHSFREDAELCFRLQEREWKVVYEPSAQAEHRRFNRPGSRRSMPAAVNLHSLKNRYLLRLYHQTGGNFWRTLLPTLFRDLQALVYVLLFERSSLSAYRWLWRHRRQIWQRRRTIQNRRSAPSADLDRWFRLRGRPLHE